MRAVGKISREDYETVIVPLIDNAALEGGRLKILSQLGPEFTGLTPGGAWEDLKIGFRGWRVIDGCAIVTDIGWIREWTRLAAFPLSFPVRVFGNQERDRAIDWLSCLPEGAGVTPRLLPESGVVVVEVADRSRPGRPPTAKATKKLVVGPRQSTLGLPQDPRRARAVGAPRRRFHGFGRS